MPTKTEAKPTKARTPEPPTAGRRWAAYVIGQSSRTLPTRLLARLRSTGGPAAEGEDVERSVVATALEIVDLREAAGHFAGDRRAAGAFDRAIEAVGRLAALDVRLGQFTTVRNTLSVAAHGLIGHTDPSLPWHALGAAIGEWEEDHWARVEGSIAAAVDGLSGTEANLAALLLRRYTPPPVAGVFHAAGMIGTAAAAGVPAVRWLIDAGRKLKSESLRLGAVVREYAVEHAAAPPWVAELAGVQALGLSVFHGLKALAAGARVPPAWDRNRGVLSFHGTPLKEIGVGKATNVVAVLDAFEEAGWPDEVTPSFRTSVALHDTIKSLNNKLSHLRFRANGQGDGVLWEPADAGG
jgi:hypothetical protein